MSSYGSDDGSGHYEDEHDNYPANYQVDAEEAEAEQDEADAVLARRIAEEELAISREEDRLSMHDNASRASRGRSASRVTSNNSHVAHLSPRASARLSRRSSARLNTRGSARLSTDSRNSARHSNVRESNRFADDEYNNDQYDNDQYDDGHYDGSPYEDDPYREEPIAVASPVDVRVSGGNRTAHDELSDNRMAQDMLDREIMALEERHAYEQGQIRDGIDHSLDYMRPRNYTPYFSVIVAIVCSGMMVVEIGFNNWEFESLQINPLLGPGVDVLLSLGAKRTDLIVVEGEWYRLFTPIFLHSGVIHLFFNMVGLYNVGVATEREFGWLKTSIIFFVSGFFGVVMSAIFVPLAVGVGASGAIFGLFGSAWADLFQNWTLYRNQAWRTLLNLTFVTAINVCLGLVPFLDNFAHIGGLICGFICGLTLLVHDRYTSDGDRKGRKTYQLCLQALSVIVLPVIILVLLLVLFLQVEAAKWCEWCAYVSCVPMPPGVPVEERWWDCTY